MEWVVESEYSQKFMDGMVRSMSVSYHKYGPLADAYPHKVDAIKSLEKRLKMYKETGNADYLIDVANFAMIESMHPGHPNFHYKPTDGGEGRVWQSGGPANERNNWGDAPQRFG